MLTRDPSDIVQRSRDVLVAESGLRLALIYGSVAGGKMRPGSDVDIAVLFDCPLDAAKKMGITERLEESLSMTVDLADLFLLNGTILRQILCKGQVLVKRDSAALAELTRKMIYNQADVMPLVRRTLTERQLRFAYG